MDIARQRLNNQQIARPAFATPAEVVAWLGAVQAQDYAGGKWAVGLRLPAATEPDIEQALADRTIVGTWPMRGTLHFVAATDVRWMLDLLTPRMVARAAARHRQLELDAATFSRARTLFMTALRGGKQLSRTAMYQLLDRAGISPDGQRGIHILWRLAQEGLICFGTREGKQQTLVLLDEWLPPAKPLARGEALAELARRYFTGHGPATVHDFTWWSGLRPVDAREAIELIKPRFLHELIAGQTYWFSEHQPTVRPRKPVLYLLPAFDEYLVGHKDRRAVLDPAHVPRLHALLSPAIVIDGQVAGTWGRSLRKGAVVVSSQPWVPLTDAEQRALDAAVRRYGAFLGGPVAG